jgi:hypothetical protein
MSDTETEGTVAPEPETTEPVTHNLEGNFVIEVSPSDGVDD